MAIFDVFVEVKLFEHTENRTAAKESPNQKPSRAILRPDFVRKFTTNLTGSSCSDQYSNG